MSLAALAHAAEAFKVLLNTTSGKVVVVEVSLEPPAHGHDEAAFIRLVLWGFSFWFEACQPAGKYLTGVVRNSNPDEFKRLSRTFQNLQNLRTFYAHNLEKDDKEDNHKLTQAGIWLSQNGKNEENWCLCTTNLCLEIISALSVLIYHWKIIVDSPEDSSNAFLDFNQALNRDWEPHLFDPIIQEIASSLFLEDFDFVAYRKIKLPEYRRITGYFVARSSAETAIRRFIKQDLILAFGV